VSSCSPLPEASFRGPIILTLTLIGAILFSLLPFATYKSPASGSRSSLMRVEVKYYAMIREATGRRVEVIDVPEGSSVDDLLGLLVRMYSEALSHFIYNEEKNVRDYLSFMLNGFNVYSLKGLDTPLQDGDVFAILPPVGGG
jgi:MoaD family protein